MGRSEGKPYAAIPEQAVRRIEGLILSSFCKLQCCEGLCHGSELHRKRAEMLKQSAIIVCTDRQR